MGLEFLGEPRIALERGANGGGPPNKLLKLLTEMREKE